MLVNVYDESGFMPLSPFINAALVMPVYCQISLASLSFSCSLLAFRICVSEDFVFFKVDIFSSFELLFGSIFKEAYIISQINYLVEKMPCV
jgi:hypothetical protein